MAPRETENNAYAKFWGDKQRVLWYVMVFLEWSIPPGYTSPGFLQDVADITLKEGSERGRVVFKELLLQYMSLVPESVLMSLLVGYISQIFFHGQEMIRRKLDYIKLPELDLD